MPHCEQNFPVFFAPHSGQNHSFDSGFLAPHSEQNLPVFFAPQAQTQPSACAGFAGAVELSKMTDYLESSGLSAHWENAAHIVWATGGALVPEGEREKYLAN